MGMTGPADSETDVAGLPRGCKNEKWKT